MKMKRQTTKFFAGLAIAFLIVLFVALTIVTTQQAQAEEERAQDAFVCRVNEISDNEDNIAQIRLTNAQIKEEKRIAAEKAEAERLEKERIAREEEERLAREEEERKQQEALAAQTQQVSYSQPNGILTKSGGVNYYNGSKETWYSSRQLYHRNTSQWTLGSDGVYRDSDGYVVVARSDMAQGSTIDTSLGKGRVHDSGCAAGVTDIYTAW